MAAQRSDGRSRSCGSTKAPIAADLRSFQMRLAASPSKARTACDIRHRKLRYCVGIVRGISQHQRQSPRQDQTREQATRLASVHRVATAAFRPVVGHSGVESTIPIADSPAMSLSDILVSALGTHRDPFGWSDLLLVVAGLVVLAGIERLVGSAIRRLVRRLGARMGAEYRKANKLRD